jgi:nucleotide-binding universal stress UspA family protein
MRPVAVRELEHQCEQLAERLRRSGVHAQWSLYCGAPDAVISARAREIDSPFILMPLRWGHRLSSLASDNVVAHVIRRSVTPVMTYRIA